MKERDELAERPGAELVDFERGRVKSRQVFDLSVVQRLIRGRRVDLHRAGHARAGQVSRHNRQGDGLKTVPDATLGR